MPHHTSVDPVLDVALAVDGAFALTVDVASALTVDGAFALTADDASALTVHVAYGIARTLSASAAAAGDENLLVAAGLAITLALVHLFGAQLQFVDVVPRSRLLSFGGGVSVAYVFVHLVPELARTGPFDETPLGHPMLVERSVYIVALLGFVTFYGLERYVVQSKDGHDMDSPPRGVYRLHLASFAGYNAIVGYLLFHREEPGTLPLVLFGVAMALHFLVNDFGFRQHYRGAYHDRGRWLLAAAVLGGAVAGALTMIDPGALDVLFAFLAGSVVLNTIKEELPESRESQFAAFALGSLLYTFLLLFV